MEIVKEVESEKYLNEVIAPWAKNTLQSSSIYTPDGVKIQVYYAIHPEEIGAVQFFHGFCEFSYKYHELMYQFYQLGYSVYFVEMRGHGKSQRFIPEKDRVFINSFDEYIIDQKTVYDRFMDRYSRTNNRICFAHSMGGCVGALFLEKYPGLFTKAILSSPMFELNYRGTPAWKVRALTITSKALKWNNRLNPGVKGWTGEDEFEKSSALSRSRYLYQFTKRVEDEDYQTSSATMSWTRAAQHAMVQAIDNASKITIPILLCQAGQDSMVCDGGQQEFVSLAQDVELIRFGTSKHEIFNGDDDNRQKYWNAITKFIAQ